MKKIDKQWTIFIDFLSEGNISQKKKRLLYDLPNQSAFLLKLNNEFILFLPILCNTFSFSVKFFIDVMDLDPFSE